VHEEGIIHRDIAPDNIFLTNKGEVKLIDFGASRYATTSRSRSLTVIIKPGYSAEEQYRSRGDQGAHTDVYSLGAVLYKMITGITPPDAMERRAQYEKNKKDMLVPISKLTKEISKNQETAIHNAMNVRIEDRTGEMITFAGELLSEEEVKRKRSGIKKIDMLTWPLWAKIGLPVGIVVIGVLTVLLAAGVIGPKAVGN
jgi:serine/threonine protein kinase